MKELTTDLVLSTIGMAGVSCASLHKRLGVDQEPLDILLQQLKNQKKITVVNGNWVQVPDAAKYYDEHGCILPEYRETPQKEYKPAGAKEVKKVPPFLGPLKRPKVKPNVCGGCGGNSNVGWNGRCTSCTRIANLRKTEFGRFVLTCPEFTWTELLRRKKNAVSRAKAKHQDVNVVIRELIASERAKMNRAAKAARDLGDGGNTPEAIEEQITWLESLRKQEIDKVNAVFTEEQISALEAAPAVLDNPPLPSTTQDLIAALTPSQVPSDAFYGYTAKEVDAALGIVLDDLRRKLKATQAFEAIEAEPDRILALGRDVKRIRDLIVSLRNEYGYVE